MPSEKGHERRHLRIVHDFAYPLDAVWSAWTTPAAMLEWFGPEHAPALSYTADFAIDGLWRASLRSSDPNNPLWASGRYRVIEPKARLAFTFRWEGDNHEDGPGVETLVTLSFRKLGPRQTRLELLQENLVSAASAEGHEGGWSSSFSRLAKFLEVAHDFPV